MLAFTRYVIQLRKRFAGLRRRHFATGTAPAAGGMRDVTWINPAGREMTGENWTSPDTRCFGCLLDAGQPHEALLIIMNNHHSAIDFVLPQSVFHGSWECMLDTSTETGQGEGIHSDAVTVLGRALLLLHGTRA
jgi:glycogen operon protein